MLTRKRKFFLKIESKSLRRRRKLIVLTIHRVHLPYKQMLGLSWQTSIKNMKVKLTIQLRKNLKRSTWKDYQTEEVQLMLSQLVKFLVLKILKRMNYKRNNQVQRSKNLPQKEIITK
jgi:hypothetical protein